MPFIETSAGVKIHYEETGEGRPLVLIHGWAGSGRIWGFQRELAGSFRLVIPDLRGHGLSTSAEDDFGLDDLVSDLVCLFDRLALEDALLVGWSLGSQVVLASFLLLRERLAGLVLVGATARFTATEGYPHGLPAREVRGMEIRLRRDFSSTMDMFFRSMFSQGELTPEMERRIALDIMADGRLPSPGAARGALAILASANLREGLADIHCPVLIIHGSDDAICPTGAARFLADRIPGARLVEFAGAGHAPPLSRPDRFNNLVREFLPGEAHESR